MTLPYLHDSGQIQQEWQRTTDHALESGYQPLLELGTAERFPNNLPVLQALMQWESFRNDVTEPIILVGGSNALWPIGLLQWGSEPQAIERFISSKELEGLAVSIAADSSAQDDKKQSPLQLVYGGADEATYLASLCTQSAHRLQSGQLFAIDVPAAMQPTVSFLTQPHTAAQWYAFPLTLLQATATVHSGQGQPEQDLVRFSAPLSSIDGTSDIAPSSNDPWLVWAALAVVVMLVCLALLT